MNKKIIESEASTLRQKAEELLKKKKLKENTQLSQEDALKLIHELQVHHIELELQNDELIQTREALSEAIDKYTELYDFAPVGYFTLSAEAEILELNLYGAKMLGEVRSKLLNNSFSLYISDESKNDFNQFIKNIFENNQIRHLCDISLIKRGLVKLQLQLSGIANSKNEICFVVATDISERKYAEEMLMRSKIELNEYFENDITSDCVIAADGEIINCNSTFLKLFGIDKESIINKLNIKPFYKNPSAREEMLRNLKENGRVLNYDVEYITTDGRTINALVNIIGYFDESGNLIKTRGYIIDNTERKKIEKKLNKYYNNLEELVKERTIELEGKNAELENFNNLFIGREFRIKELRDKVKELKDQIIKLEKGQR